MLFNTVHSTFSLTLKQMNQTLKETDNFYGKFEL